jgi:hypothetical protein
MRNQKQRNEEKMKCYAMNNVIANVGKMRKFMREVLHFLVDNLCLRYDLDADF